MPELPEVETICRSLNKEIKTLKICGINVFYDKIIKAHNVKDFSSSLINKKVVSVKRIGKAINILLSDDYTMLIQLKMTGRFYMPAAEENITKHTHLLFKLNDGRTLAFEDIRKFACIYLEKSSKINNLPYIQKLGCEPLSNDFTETFLMQKLAKSPKKNIKSFLLDQHIICGIGNIYASEILFYSKINPDRNCSSIKKKEIRALYKYIPFILKESIKNKGTTFSDYRDVDGNKGNFANKLTVYGRKDKPCTKCKSTIIKTVTAGRSTFSCPKCQK